MKWQQLSYSLLFFGLYACQSVTPPINCPLPPPIQASPFIHHEKESDQTLTYGSVFASEYKEDPQKTCLKYKALDQQGDWRAGWVMALHSDKKLHSCLKPKEALSLLKQHASEKKLTPELLWLNQSHLNLLLRKQKQSKEISRLKSTIKEKELQVTDLTSEIEKYLEKFDALKAIETNIIK